MMNARNWLGGLLAIALIAGLAGQVWSSDPAGGPGEGQPQMSAEDAAMWAKWQEVAAPGKPHQLLEQLVGNWTVKSRYWMGEGEQRGEPLESTGAAKVTAILGGRYVMEDYQGQFFGMPFTGMGLTGYDNYKGRYTSVWVDNMSTAMTTSLGSANQSGTVLTFYGEMDEPTMDQHDKLFKMVLRLVSADKHVMEMHDLDLPEGKQLVMELTYLRKK